MAAGMNRNAYLAFHKLLCEEALALSTRKNHDYSGGKDGTHPFQNFQFVEMMNMGVTTEQGFLVRLGDKIKRLSGFCRTGKFEVADESFRDTCIDVINYICLLAAYMEHKRQLDGGVDSDPGDCHMEGC